jgi:hypothetical protein
LDFGYTLNLQHWSGGDGVNAFSRLRMDVQGVAFLTKPAFLLWMLHIPRVSVAYVGWEMDDG